MVTGTAASAAADLLMAGDYAIAYPHARILCHGVRQGGQNEALTHEKASQLARSLANSNERFAIQLADNCINRFIFRIATLSKEFEGVRDRLNAPEMPYSACFIDVLRGRIANVLIEVLEQAQKRSSDNDALDLAVSKALIGHDIMSMPQSQFEVLLLKTIIEYEAQQHADDVDWSFRERGLEIIGDKLDLLLDKYSNHHRDMTAGLSDRWGGFFLSSQQENEIAMLPDDEKPAQIEKTVGTIIRPLWFFFVSLCRALQRDDYLMSAVDAYWLGLIDEVVGTDLPCLRLIVEYAPDAPDEPKSPTTSGRT